MNRRSDGKPNSAAALTIIQTVFVSIPCAVVGAHLWKFTGLVVGITVGAMLSAIIAVIYGRRLLRAPTMIA